MRNLIEKKILVLTVKHDVSHRLYERVLIALPSKEGLEHGPMICQYLVEVPENLVNETRQLRFGNYGW